MRRTTQDQSAELGEAACRGGRVRHLCRPLRPQGAPPSPSTTMGRQRGGRPSKAAGTRGNLPEAVPGKIAMQATLSSRPLDNLSACKITAGRPCAPHPLAGVGEAAVCATTVVRVGTLRATVLTRRRDGGEGFCATHASVHCSMILRCKKAPRHHCELLFSRMYHATPRRVTAYPPAAVGFTKSPKISMPHMTLRIPFVFPMTWNVRAEECWIRTNWE